MKKIIFSVFLVLSLLVSYASAEFFSDVIVTSPNGIWTDARAYTTLNDALAAVGTDVRTVKIVSPQVVTTLTVLSNTTLEFERDGSITNSGQLTINTENIVAPNRRIFTGVGDIDFARGSVVKTAWFSDVVEAFDMTADDYITLVISEPDFITADCSVGNDVNLKWESPRNRLTANAGFTLSNIGDIEAGNFQLFAGAGDFDYRDGVRLKSSWFNLLRSATTWIENEEVTLVIQGTVDASYTQASGTETTLDLISDNGYLDINPGVILTVNGPFICDENKIANSGTGTLVLGEGASDRMNVKWFGAVGDGVTVNTAPVQSAFDCAYDNKLPVYFPKGKFVIGTITYYGQSIYGIPGSGNQFPEYNSTEISILKGLPSQDILAFEDITTASKPSMYGQVVRDIAFILNDSVDASALFPNRARDGVGNACIAFEWSDGATQAQPSGALTLMQTKFINVSFQSDSLTVDGQNASCGIFNQGHHYGAFMNNVSFSRFAFGYWSDYPTVNVLSVDYGSGDSQNWIEPIFNGNGKAFQHYNGSWCKMQGAQIYSVDEVSLNIRNVTSGSRNAAWNWHFADIFNEGNFVAESEFMFIDGFFHVFDNFILHFGTGDGYVTWDASHCTVTNASFFTDIGAALNTLRISGDHNRFELNSGVTFTDPWQTYNAVTDTGSGNRVIMKYCANVSNTFSRPLAINNFREGMLSERNADFAQTTPSAPYFNNNDLFLWPSDLTWIIGTQPVITKDATVVSGEYATLLNPGGAAVNVAGFLRRSFHVGYEVPMEKCMFYIRLKNATSNTTQYVYVSSDVTTVGGKTLSTTTSWATYSFPLDFTLAGVVKGEELRIYCNNSAAAQDVHVAWIAIVPVKPYYVGLERSADPPEPDEGQFYMWMSDGTGKGDDGDVMIGGKAGGTANYGTLFDHSGGAAW